jgi:phosphatidate cytidylyltransferase
LFGGMILSVVVTTVIMGQIEPWGSVGHAFALGVAAAIAAPVGDLCESLLKRDLGVKDMGAILPGHGGLLDRFDALLFVLPVTYEVARWLDVGLR